MEALAEFIRYNFLNVEIYNGTEYTIAKAILERFSLKQDKDKLMTALNDLINAVTYSHKEDFGTLEEPNMCWVARVPVEFIDNAKSAYAQSRET